MSDNVIPFGGVTRLDLPTDRVLEEAKGQVVDGGVVVLGWDKEGEVFFSSSIADGGEVIWLLEKAKLALLSAEVPA